MKSTKRILSAILSLCMIFGCLAVGFTAQASAADLVAAVAGDSDVNWTGGDVTLTDTLTITGDKKVDLNGAVITGPAGKPAVVINGNVTLYDGVVIADQGNFSGEMAFLKALMNYEPAITVKGGNVVLECVTAVGSLLRVPNSGTVELPIGNGICTDGGNVVIRNSIAIGMNALDNDNLSSNVTVEDAILIGIYKAVNRSSRVDFGGDAYTQYKTIDFLEGFLQDGVTLSAKEKQYIDSATNSEGKVSVASVLVNVANPSFNEITSEYINGTLNVYAQADVSNEVAGVSNRYSYAYNPATCEVDGQTAEFELVDGQYVAQFTGLEENQEFEAKANYDLSIKLGKKQKEVVQNALDKIAAYVDKAPELLYRFVEDFEALYEKAEGYLGLAFNALTDPYAEGFVEGLEELVGLIYALEGQEFAGYAENEKDDTGLVEAYSTSSAIGNAWRKYLRGAYTADKFVEEAYASMTARKDDLADKYGAIFDTDGDEVADSLFAYTNDIVFTDKSANVAVDQIDFFKNGTPGFGSGVGLLDAFDVYYKNIMGEVYGTGTTEFVDLEGAAAYIAENWEDIYGLVENVVVVMDKAYELLSDDDGKVNALLGEIGLGSYASYVDKFMVLAAPDGYVHAAMAEAEKALYSDTVQKYIGTKENAVKYCTYYTKKAWTIVNNLDTYFNVDVKGDYVNLDFGHFTTGTVNTNVVKKPVNVKVTVSGLGYAQLKGFEKSTQYDVDFKYGEDILVEAVTSEFGGNLVYMVVKTNGNSRVVTDGVYSAKAATNVEIVLVFQSEINIEEGNTEITVMTDKALNYKYLGKAEIAKDDIEFEWSSFNFNAPVFKDIVFKGWSLDRDGANVELKIADLASAIAAAAENGDVMVYAIYTFDETVTVPTHPEKIKMTGTSVADGKVYFDISVQLKGAEAIEAGVIVTKNAELATADNMVITLSGTPGVAFSRIGSDQYDSEGYLFENIIHTVGVKTASGTVYGRGYVVFKDGTVEYTEITSGTI